MHTTASTPWVVVSEQMIFEPATTTTAPGRRATTFPDEAGKADAASRPAAVAAAAATTATSFIYRLAPLEWAFRRSDSSSAGLDDGVRSCIPARTRNSPDFHAT